MKLLFLFFLLPFAASAQQDFDYTIYTRHADMPVNGIRGDSNYLQLLLERRIVKEANRLTVIPISNTGNAVEYKINFYGVQFGEVPSYSHSLLEGTKTFSFQYVTEDLKYKFSIWPTIPLVEVQEPKTGRTLDRYY